ncbi:MAG: 3-isopropylmalate dehydratase small subunit [Spirochaetales bacterium]|nr:3-isopropylmalate dehydratase small subunit [Spirochaetales bacterium]
MSRKSNPVPSIKSIQGKCIPVRGNEIDTDRIIPARFMKVVTFDGLGEYAFQDERFDQDGRVKPHPFNEDSFKGASILLVNKNFGCGSSREHAPQALQRWGIKAIIGESFAEIFAGNCDAMGIPTATVPPDVIEELMTEARNHPKAELKMDLEEQAIMYNGNTYAMVMNRSSRSALLAGTWDSTATLLSSMEEINNKFEELPYINSF